MPLTRLDLRGARDRLEEALARPKHEGDDVSEAVAGILAAVRSGGDDSLRQLTAQFDGVVIDSLAVAPQDIAGALERIPAELRQALEVARRRIGAYHERDSVQEADFVSDGVRVTDLVRPVARVGCYVPGGLARYPSTVLMCAIPARVAGVGEIALCVPAGPDGRVDDATLAAAALCGIDEVYRVGGAQAVGAMAFGTQSIAAVDCIVGPGNRYVAEAMRQVSGVVGIPAAFAGPSEILVVAGPETPAELAAIDLAVQAEHGPDGGSWLVSWSSDKLDEVDAALERIIAASPRRASLEATLSSGGYACLVEGPEEAVAVSNVVAPEHLELIFDDARRLLPLIESAGAVFLGPWSPSSVGDYLAGPNHVLPTNRSARFSSALSTRDFRRHIHVVEVEHAALQELGVHVQTLAATEGLAAHVQSIEMRR